VLTYLLAILAACANATSSVLQRKANLQVPGKQDLSPRLIRSLLHEPAWFGGVLAVSSASCCRPVLSTTVSCRSSSPSW